MTKENNAALHKIMEDLKAGYSYGTDRIWNYYNNEPYRFPYFDTRLSIGYGHNLKKYIFWTHFGSSANPVTLRDLEWIITVIFRLSPVEFLQEYIRNDASKIA